MRRKVDFIDVALGGPNVIILSDYELCKDFRSSLVAKNATENSMAERN